MYCLQKTVNYTNQLIIATFTYIWTKNMLVHEKEHMNVYKQGHSMRYGSR